VNAILVGIGGPLVGALVVLVITRHLNAQDRAAAGARRDLDDLHKVLRELVRAFRELGGRLRLPPGW
jgi:hypothetical protein